MESEESNICSLSLSLSLMVAFNKNDINTIEDAKNYEGYNNKKLNGTRGGKTAKIFESSKLNKDDGTLDKTKLQDLAEYLHIYKTAKVKANDLNSPVTDWAPLLGKLWQERRNNSDFYQLVNNRGKGGKIDLVIEKLEDRLFRKVGDISPSQIIEFQNKQKRLTDLVEKGKEKDKEINKAAEKCSPEKIKEATDYLAKVRNAVDALKDDLKDNTKAGYRILNEIISYTRETCDNIFTTTAPKSLITTGFNDTGIPLTQSLFLTRDFPQQFIALFKKFDKEQLFSVIDDTSWSPSEKKEIKNTYERMMTWTFQRSWNFKIEKHNKGQRLKERFQEGKFDEEEAKKKERDYIFVSDVLKFMHALFPKSTDYKNSPFIKAGDKLCLKLTGSDNLDTKFPVYWRGRDNSVVGEIYSGGSLFDANFTSEKKELSWANGELVEFFWKVYNEPDCVDFSARDEVISKDGNTKRTIRSEPISKYEEKILTYQKRHRLVDAMAQSYLERAIEIIEANGINYKERVHEWKPIIRKISESAIKTWEPLMRKAKKFASHQAMVDASEKIGWNTNATQYIEYDKETITTEVIREYDQMKLIAQAQIDAFDPLKAEWGKKLDERKEITKEENKVNQEINDFENLIKVTLNDNLIEVRKQFKQVYDHPRSDGNLLKYSIADYSFMKNLLTWIEKRENEPQFSIDPAFTTQIYKTDLENQEKNVWGMMKPNYKSWIQLDRESFLERIEVWKKTAPSTYSENFLRTHLLTIKNELELEGSLGPEEKSNLREIDSYLNKPIEEKITNERLRLALRVDIVSSSLVDEWKNLESSKKFSTDAKEIREIADKINNLSDKDSFLGYLETNLATDANLPIYPKNDSEKIKLDWFFSLSPKLVIETIANRELVADSTLKDTIIKEMKEYNVNDEILDSSKYKKDDKGEFTDEAINQFYYEKLAGQNHSTKRVKDEESPPKDKSTSDNFWKWDNPYAWIGGISLAAGTGLVLYAIIRW
jgi:hypothetical protein